jgi:ribulose-bisphosphate carboxylase large chain
MGGLDFTKDDENVNSQPFMRWRAVLSFVPKQFIKHKRKPVKSRALLECDCRCEEMIKRAGGSGTVVVNDTSRGRK